MRRLLSRQLPLVLAGLGSLLLHALALGIGPGLDALHRVRLTETAFAPDPDDLAPPSPATEPEPRLTPGREDGEPATLTWIGYDEYRRHVAETVDDFEQAAFTAAEARGRPDAAAPSGALAGDPAPAPPPPPSSTTEDMSSPQPANEALAAAPSETGDPPPATPAADQPINTSAPGAESTLVGEAVGPAASPFEPQDVADNPRPTGEDPLPPTPAPTTAPTPSTAESPTAQPADEPIDAPATPQPPDQRQPEPDALQPAPPPSISLPATPEADAAQARIGPLALETESVVAEPTEPEAEGDGAEPVAPPSPGSAPPTVTPEEPLDGDAPPAEPAEVIEAATPLPIPWAEILTALEERIAEAMEPASENPADTATPANSEATPASAAASPSSSPTSVAARPAAARGEPVEANAERSSQDSLAVALQQATEFDIETGQPVSMRGVEIRPYALYRHIVIDAGDTLFGLRWTGEVKANPVASLRFDRRGRVRSIEVLRPSGYTAFDAQYLVSWLTRWTASGTAIRALGPRELSPPFVVKLMFIDEPAGDDPSSPAGGSGNEGGGSAAGAGSNAPPAGAADGG